MNLGNCEWPNCMCKTEAGEPCKFDNPDFYINRKDKQLSKVENEAPSYGIGLNHEHTINKGADMMLGEIRRELDRARAKFPSSVCCLAALMEETGELAQAMLKNAAGKWPQSRIREEAVQVAAMAIRCAIEGDESLTSMGYSEPNTANQ